MHTASIRLSLPEKNAGKGDHHHEKPIILFGKQFYDCCASEITGVVIHHGTSKDEDEIRSIELSQNMDNGSLTTFGGYSSSEATNFSYISVVTPPIRPLTPSTNDVKERADNLSSESSVTTMIVSHNPAVSPPIKTLKGTSITMKDRKTYEETKANIDAFKGKMTRKGSGEFQFHEIRSTDVLFGRGKFEREHPGNRRMKELLDLYRVAYQTTPDRRMKFAISKVIVDTIKNNGNRFLKYNTTNQCWCAVEDNVARHKVSHAMRDTNCIKSSTTYQTSFDSSWDTSSESSSVNGPNQSIQPPSLTSIFSNPHDADLMIELFSSPDTKCW